MSRTVIGFALIIFASLCGGVFAVPIKLKHRFELENLYVMAASVTMIVLPLVLAPFLLPHWTEAIAGAGSDVIWRGLGFGFAWGMGAITFGYGISIVGLSLGYALIMGINTAVGSILPFVLQSKESLFQASGVYILLGIAGCVLGVLICGVAGQMRARGLRDAVPAAGVPVSNPGSSEEVKPASQRFLLGLLLCLISGVMSACANLGFAFTSEVGAAAVRLGASPVIAGLGSWMLVYWGGFLATFLWFGSQQLRKGTWRNNFGPGALHDTGLAIAMGLLWFLAMIPYGMGAFYLGRLGTSVGWAINIAASLIIANALGFLTGEWKAAPAISKRMLVGGLAVLIIAMALLAKGNSLAASRPQATESKTILPAPSMRRAEAAGRAIIGAWLHAAESASFQRK
jgi:L-rhamnose-H+ transport protein